jgi:hypothetical protein
MWQTQGKISEAVGLVGNVLSQFTEGFKCKDWIKADLLLNTLKSEQPRQEHSELA